MQASLVLLLLLLIQSLIACTKNAGISSRSITARQTNNFNLPTLQLVPYTVGGAHVTFTNIPAGHEKLDTKCNIYTEGGVNEKVHPEVSHDMKSVICRLPPNITSGFTGVDLEVDDNLYRSVQVIIPVPKLDLKVEEDWNRRVIDLSWDPAYFNQFYPNGESIFLELTIFTSDNGTTKFTESTINLPVGWNDGTRKFEHFQSRSSSDIVKNFHFPYFYILRPAGTRSDVYLSSRFFTPTFGMNVQTANQICANFLTNAIKLPPLVPTEISPCPNCLCKAKLDKDFIETEYDPQILSLTGGRLANHKLYYERLPTKNGYAQSCSYNSKTDALVTGRSGNAGWIHRVSKHVSYPENYMTDIWPFIVCCLQASDSNLCEAFHNMRPIDTGHKYTGADQPCQGWGDPHMVTFDGVWYDFQGFGEFWLIRGTQPGTTNFGVQGRMAPVGPNHRVTWFKAVAIREGNTTVQIQIGNNANFLIIVNRAISLALPQAPSTMTLHDISLSISGRVVDVRVKTGFTIQVVHHSTFFNVYGFGAQRNKGKGYVGLFGNFDGTMANDLTNRGGVAIQPTTRNLRNLSLIHNIFGMSWITSPIESYFVYENGRDWHSYNNPNFLPILEYPDPAKLPEEVRAVCKENLACYYEYVGTNGDLQAAKDTVKAKEDYDKLKEEIATQVPMCDPIGSPQSSHVSLSVESYTNGSIATYKCRDQYDVYNGTLTRTCVDTGKGLFWNGAEPFCIWTCTPCTAQYRLKHDPSDCTKYFICAFGQRFSQRCRNRERFNRKTLVCDRKYECSGQPGC